MWVVEVTTSYSEALREVLKGHWDMLPIVLTAFGSVVLGALLAFGEMSFTEPAVPAWYARQFFRGIGLVLMFSPLWAYIRARRGYYDAAQ